MTDTDRLSTSADMVDLLKHLAKIMRDVEALPDNAQQRFWDDTNHGLEAIAAEEFRLEHTLTASSVRVFYNILATMCGPQLAEMVNGASKEYYESIISQMKEVTHRSWDTFLDQKLDETKDTDHEGVAVVSVRLATINDIGGGLLKRVEGVSKLLKLTDTRLADKTECYFSSKDIILMEFARTHTPEP